MVLSHVGPRIWVSNVLCSLSVSQPVKHPSAHTNTHHQATVHPTGISHVGSPKFWQLYGRNRHLQVVNCDGDRQLQAAVSPGLKIGISYAVHHAGRGQASESAITFTALSTSPGLEIGHHLHKVIHLAGPRAQLSRPLRRLSRRRRAASGATDPRSAGLRQPRNTLRNAQLPQKLEYAPQEIRNEEDDNRKQADCGDEPLSAHLARQHLLVCRNGKDGLLPYTSVQLKKRSDG